MQLPALTPKLLLKEQSPGGPPSKESLLPLSMVWTEDISLHHSDSDVRGAVGNGPIRCVPASFSIPSSSRLASACSL